MSFLDEVDEVEAKAALGRIPRRAALGTAGIALLVCIIAFFGIATTAGGGFSVEKAPSSSSAANPGSAGESEAQTGEPVSVYVYLVGEVARPGVYCVPEGSRINDAVELAGGFTEEADGAAVNLARVVVDGEQVSIPSKGAQQLESVSGAVVAGDPGSFAPLNPPDSASSATTGISADGKVDINRASASELETLDGIGPATAQKIVASREQDGPFSSKEDLKRVSGIGDRKLAAIADSITL